MRLPRFRKGTNDHDGDGAKGGSLPDAGDERILRLEAELEEIKAIMRRNGWTMEACK